MNEENRRYNRCNLRKTKKKSKMDNDEVATDYKLKQFLDDVQKFTERSKIPVGQKNLNRKSTNKSKQIQFKRGLFENGLKSKLCLKENRARLSGNLNDLVKECPQPVVDEKESSSSCDPGSPPFEGRLDKDINDAHHELATNDNNERLTTSENKFASCNDPYKKRNTRSIKDVEEKRPNDVRARKSAKSLFHKDAGDKINMKDKAQIIELWEKHCEGLLAGLSWAKKYTSVDHEEMARQKINEMIYQTFLDNARNYPSILKRIFSNNEIKLIAEIVINDTVDKSVQTDDLPAINSCVNNPIQTGDNFPLSFQPTPKGSNSRQEEAHFFDLNVPKENNPPMNFLESLENQPDIFSPTVQNISLTTKTPPPSPLPPDILKCWAPSTASTPRRPEIISPEPLPQSSNFFNWQSPRIERFVARRHTKINSSSSPSRKSRRKTYAEPSFNQSVTLESPLQLYFPKRKKVTFSPHRL